MDIEDQFLGAKVKQARVSKNISQEDLARLLKLPRQTISAIESGKRKVTAIEILRICWFLDAEISLSMVDCMAIFGRSN